VTPLPIDPVLPEVVAALRRGPNLVLRAPTGAGKTTRVPPALLDGGVAESGRILVLEPRRLAARAAARRMAAERAGRLGDEVGYHVRFDRRCGPQTRILAVTPGVLLRFLHDDPYLETTGAVVFDEFHERGLESDLALGLVRLIQQTVRPELRIVAMSATLAVEAVATYLGDCPVVVSEGRSFPVEVAYEPRPDRQPWPVAAARAAERLLDRTDGDLLVFLPGLYEIRQTARQLEAVAAERGLAVLPLHGDLPPEQQDAALLPQIRRKIVLATNVAETSVTVEGVAAVADTGLARVMEYDPGVGLDRLKLAPISRASADQRAGRAGRTRPGVCVRLWGAGSHHGRPEQTEPEIRRVDLAGAVLQLLCFGEAELATFPWLEAPREATVARALTLLRRLGAMEGPRVTELGRSLVRLPVQPRLAMLLIDGARRGFARRAALAAALLSERELFPRTLDESPRGSGRRSASDVVDRVEALEAFEREGRTASAVGDLHRGAARAVLQVRDQLVRAVRRGTAPAEPAPHTGDEALMRSLLAAYPDRLARRRGPGDPRGVMVGGRGVRLGPSTAVDAELFVCIDVDAGKGESWVRQASAVERDWLPQDHLATSVEVAFDAVAERVVARKRVRFEDLVLEDVPATPPDTDEVGRVLAGAGAGRLDRVAPPDDSPAGRLRTRVRCLREWMPELGLAALDEADLADQLEVLCQGCRSFAEVRDGPWLESFQARLTHKHWLALESEAPGWLVVPSGSRIVLRYELGRPPVLAVRIQEVFGLKETPRVAGGRVRVLLHLLAPNYRPQQVTDDLASFWSNTYPQVRKELRTRYPRHAWPENPYTASAESRPRRR
jgi:ATP-dependent helicase HrpB